MDDYNNNIKGLKEKQYVAIVHSDEYKTILTQLCERIINKSKTAPNEATIESYFDCELFAFFKDIFVPLGFDYSPVKESSVSTRRHVTKGRADTAIGALVVEFKQPSRLSNKQLQDKAVSQVMDYMLGMDNESETVGFVTDGTKGCFVVKNVDNEIHAESFSKLSFHMFDRLVQSIISLRLTALSSRNLVDNFCNPPANDGIAFQLVRSLHSGLVENMTPKTTMLFNEWKELFNLSHDDISKQQAIIDRKKSLEDLLGATFSEADEEYIALFALQTAYIIIVKAVAYRIVSIVKYDASFIDFEALSTVDEGALRQQMISLEEGAVFRSYGIANLLEGDFFSWYTAAEQWTPEIAGCISNVFSVLNMYSDKAVLNSETKSADFFKELYQEMTPAAVRHSLGEYYTKCWIARQVVEESIALSSKRDWTGIDPCCGSGTFLTVMINKIMEETADKDDQERLEQVLNRVKGIDLNPVAVLTARVNYFINIAPLITDQPDLEIPVYLGDSSYVPRKKDFHDVPCLEYSINTLLDPINILVPASMVSDPYAFSKAMTDIEVYVRNLDEGSTYSRLESLVSPDELIEPVREEIRKLSAALVDLERKNWNGIWARIITNYLTTANLGRFDIIVGNPPWVDWKSLPSGYRDKIKSLCISRHLFSGDRVTGGINLNICALISNVVAENWLAEDGVLGFLMPEPLIFQPSYEGFRNLYLEDGSRLYFKRFTNWTLAGHPFKPVAQKFLTYYITRDQMDYRQGVDVDWFILKKHKNCDGIEDIDLDEYFDRDVSIAATCNPTKNAFSYVRSREQLAAFMSVAGESYYIGREGIEFYPQEMTIFETSGFPSTATLTSLKNIQVKKSKYHVPQNVELLETEFLHPLIKGVDVHPFHIDNSGYIVPFPYDERDARLPISLTELSKRAPKLAAFYQKYKDLILSQTTYNERIIGRKGEFYSMARVGAYSFAKNHVVFRDNTKWGAAVTSLVDTEWGGPRLPVFQNHAVSISEDADGNFISLDEAHYICAILNSMPATDYVLNSSDSRSFPIRPRIYIPKFDPGDPVHVELSEISKEAHEKYDSPEDMSRIILRINELHLYLANNR